MKLYLALNTAHMLLEGPYEHILGVFSTPELASAEFKKDDMFADAEKVAEFTWKYIFDGELTHYWEVIPVTLDEGMLDY